mmetsp:Transcript_34050/g.97838  ORF Transcript_34050/g.97838 Transcript_34050/m.97838 type:complete len:711 (-) Transcript_34050:291-2423(-)
MDADGSGYLSIEELSQALTNEATMQELRKQLKKIGIEEERDADDFRLALYELWEDTQLRQHDQECELNQDEFIEGVLRNREASLFSLWRCVTLMRMQLRSCCESMELDLSQLRESATGSSDLPGVSSKSRATLFVNTPDRPSGLRSTMTNTKSESQEDVDHKEATASARSSTGLARTSPEPSDRPTDIAEDLAVGWTSSRDAPKAWSRAKAAEETIVALQEALEGRRAEADASHAAREEASLTLRQVLEGRDAGAAPAQAELEALRHEVEKLRSFVSEALKEGVAATVAAVAAALAEDGKNRPRSPPIGAAGAPEGETDKALAFQSPFGAGGVQRRPPSAPRSAPTSPLQQWRLQAPLTAAVLALPTAGGGSPCHGGSGGMARGQLPAASAASPQALLRPRWGASQMPASKLGRLGGSLGVPSHQQHFSAAPRSESADTHLTDTYSTYAADTNARLDLGTTPSASSAGIASRGLVSQEFSLSESFSPLQLPTGAACAPSRPAARNGDRGVFKERLLLDDVGSPSSSSSASWWQAASKALPALAPREPSRGSPFGSCREEEAGWGTLAPSAVATGSRPAPSSAAHGAARGGGREGHGMEEFDHGLMLLSDPVALPEARERAAHPSEGASLAHLWESNHGRAGQVGADRDDLSSVGGLPDVPAALWDTSCSLAQASSVMSTDRELEGPRPCRLAAWDLGTGPSGGYLGGTPG